jgi:NTE family protein
MDQIPPQGLTGWLRRGLNRLHSSTSPEAESVAPPTPAAPESPSAAAESRPPAPKAPRALAKSPGPKLASAKPASAKPTVTKPTVTKPTGTKPAGTKSIDPAQAAADAPPAAVGLSLALQGGGALGAFTWGVLDRLLEAELPIGRISGASAGAVNGVVLAAALARGGHAEARASLDRVWYRIAEAGRPTWPSFAARGGLVLHWLSPYQLNPYDHNPLRTILAEEVDWAALRGNTAPALFVSATRIRDGRLELFTGDRLDVEAVLASAALPTISHAIEIDGEAYWDGGYSANPALDPLVEPAGAADILLVRLNPTERPGVPKTARHIAERMNQIVFDRPLLDALDRLAPVLSGERFRLHQITADRVLEGLEPGSAVNLDWEFLTGLRDAGRAEAELWLASGALRIGDAVSASAQPERLSPRRPAA